MSTIPAANPIVATAAATLWDVPKRLRLVQLIDDAEDIADSDDFVLTINGQTLTAKIQVGTTGGAAPVEDVSPNVGNICVWQIGPFNPGILIDSFVITTIDHGALHVWTD